MSEKPYVSVENISKWYPYKGDKLINHEKKFIKGNDDINLSIQKGEILGVIGESGCGKSTLGKLLTRLETPTAGDCLINGVSTKELIKNDMKAFRRSVQIIFQNPFDTFTPRDTIEQILLRPLKNHNIGNSKEERRKLCIERLEEGGLVPGEDIMKRYPHELSGGQLQRISIIRAMLLDPEFIVADEPVSMLDVSVRAEIINMLLDLAKLHNTAVMFISHDIALTRYISDNIAVMYLGKVVEYGKADEVVNNPGHPYTKALISNCASIDPDDEREEISITGEPPTPLDPGPGCYFAPRCFMACEKCLKEYPDKKYLSDTHWITCMNAE